MPLSGHAVPHTDPAPVQASPAGAAPTTYVGTAPQHSRTEGGGLLHTAGELLDLPQDILSAIVHHIPIEAVHDLKAVCKQLLISCRNVLRLPFYCSSYLRYRRREQP